MPKAVRVGVTARLPPGWGMTLWGNVECDDCFAEDEALDGATFVDLTD